MASRKRRDTSSLASSAENPVDKKTIAVKAASGLSQAKFHKFFTLYNHTIPQRWLNGSWETSSKASSSTRFSTYIKYHKDRACGLIQFCRVHIICDINAIKNEPAFGSDQPF